MGNAERAVKTRATKWRKRADVIERRIGEQRFSERGAGEAQGYVRALRECADQIAATIERAERRRTWVR